MLVDLHLSETNRSCQARTWMACVTHEDANRYANSSPLLFAIDKVTENVTWRDIVDIHKPQLVKYIIHTFAKYTK